MDSIPRRDRIDREATIGWFIEDLTNSERCRGVHMFENALWDVYFKLEKAEQARSRRAWAWVKRTYDGEFEVHTPNSLFDARVIVFAPTERKYLNPFEDRRTSDANAAIRVLRKAMSVYVPEGQVKNFELMRESGATLPWIQATLRKRSGNEIAWMLLMKDAVVAKKGIQYEGDTEYYLVYRDETEVYPKTLVTPPPYVLV